MSSIVEPINPLSGRKAADIHAYLFQSINLSVFIDYNRYETNPDKT